MVDIASIVKVLTKLPTAKLSTELLIQFITNEFKVAGDNLTELASTFNQNASALADAVVANTSHKDTAPLSVENTVAAATTISDAHASFSDDTKVDE